MENNAGIGRFEAQSQLQKGEWEAYVENYSAGAASGSAMLEALLLESKINDAIEKKGLKADWPRYSASFSPYISAAAYLAFVGRAPDRISIQGMVAGAGVKADDDALNFAASLNLTGIECCTALYSLLIAGMEINAINIIRLVTACNKKVGDGDPELVIRLYNEQLNGREPSEIEGSFGQVLKCNLFLGKNLTLQLRRALRHPLIPGSMKRLLVPYMLIANEMYLSGIDPALESKDSWKSVIENVFEALKMEYSEKVVDYIFNMIKISVVAITVYVPAIYFVKSTSNALTMENLVRTVEAAGQKADGTSAGYMIVLYQDYGGV